MNAEVENHIRQNHAWNKLPANVKQILGNSSREYDKAVVQFSVNNQLRHKTNLVKTIRKDEKRYYEDLLQYSQEHLMLYPYHLSDVIVKGLRVTPFIYYINMMSDIMSQEKSYDSLPNFTAADCLRLLGIGRNQYIDLMNQCRSSKKFFRKKPPKELLPTKPIDTVTIDAWWMVNIGYITEDDIRVCSGAEKALIDSIIDIGPQTAAEVDHKVVNALYRKGLVYLDCPINDDDCIIVPPLEGFVMNRVLGDYLETLLYKIFVSIDEHTTVSELATVLQIDLNLVKNAVSMYCRLGFAKKKGADLNDEDLHPSWRQVKPQSKKVSQDQLILDWGDALIDFNDIPAPSPVSKTPEESTNLVNLENAMENSQIGAAKRIAFLFDSTLTAFLMMGNLSPGLKSHAVTMFEVGKLSDESLDSFLSELEKVGFEAEGEARRYFVHALMLRDTVRFLRYNKNLCSDMESGSAVDLIRCESLLSLEPSTRSRVLNKNYSLLVSMAPLSYEIQAVSSCTPQHIGPAIPEVNSVWFKLYTYYLTGSGPPSLLLVKGTKLRKLPKVLLDYDRLLITTWGHDPGIIATSNILLTLNDALSHSAILVQMASKSKPGPEKFNFEQYVMFRAAIRHKMYQLAHGWQSEGKTVHIPFPLDKTTGAFSKRHYHNHSAIIKLCKQVDLEHLCGYVTLLNTGRESRTLWKHEEDDLDLNTSFNFRVTDTSSVHSGDSNLLIDAPSNGLKDRTSAEVLASEIDLLDKENFENSNNSSSGKDQLNLDLKLDGGSVSGDENEPLVEDEWNLLECYFGIPLFESSINKQICEKIVSNGLCNSDSLQELLGSGRRLSLKLLNFIARCQDMPAGSDKALQLSDTLDQTASSRDHFTPGKDQSTPYPTKSLIFAGGVLKLWNGQ